HVGRRTGEVDGVAADLPDLEDIFEFELFDRVDGHRRGSWSAGPGPAFEILDVMTSAGSAIAGNPARRSHHVHDAGNETGQNEHDETERRCRQQAVTSPA